MEYGKRPTGDLDLDLAGDLVECGAIGAAEDQPRQATSYGTRLSHQRTER